MRETEKPRQLPLDLGHSPGYSRDELVVSEANWRAVALVDGWPDWPGPVVVLAGPAGSGKSHLATIWSEKADAAILKPAEITAWLEGSPLKHSVLVDDADAENLDERGLFHLINAVHGSGRSLLLTSRRFPSAWGVDLPDLASRLKAAPTVEILEPDDLLLAGVITKLFADRQIEVEPHVVQFLVRRIERSLSTAISVVDRLDAASLEQNARITRALAAEAINAMDQGQSEFDL